MTVFHQRPKFRLLRLFRQFLLQPFRLLQMPVDDRRALPMATLGDGAHVDAGL
jgi:hypothetical protein